MGEWESGKDPTGPSRWELKCRPFLPADVPSGKGHPDSGLAPSPGRDKPRGRGGVPRGHGLHVSPDPGRRGRLPTARPHTFLQHLWEIITLPTLKKHSQQILVS